MSDVGDALDGCSDGVGAGDCDGNGRVTVSELVTAVSAAISGCPVEGCPISLAETIP